MTRASSVFLIRIREYLSAHSPQARRQLLRMFKKHTGKSLHTTNLSRTLSLRTEPKIDLVMVLLRFAFQNGIIEAGPKNLGLFVYVNPPAANPAEVKKHLARYIRAGKVK